MKPVSESWMYADPAQIADRLRIRSRAKERQDEKIRQVARKRKGRRIRALLKKKELK